MFLFCMTFFLLKFCDTMSLYAHVQSSTMKLSIDIPMIITMTAKVGNTLFAEFSPVKISEMFFVAENEKSLKCLGVALAAQWLASLQKAMQSCIIQKTKSKGVLGKKYLFTSVFLHQHWSPLAEQYVGEKLVDNFTALFIQEIGHIVMWWQPPALLSTIDLMPP